MMPHIFVYGPPGSGKSTVGKWLAERLRLPFVDLDQAIEARADESILNILSERGESDFRELEASMLRERVNGRESVVALGGGALLRPENRALAEGSGQVICLTAAPETLMRRLQSDPNPRPLLAGDLEEKLTSLMAERAEHYNSFALKFEVDQAPSELLWQIQVVVGRFHLNALDEYDVIVRRGGLEQLGSMLQQRGLQNPLVVTDENVSGLYGPRVMDSLQSSGYKPMLLTIPAGEGSKNLDTVNRLWHGMLEGGLDRKSAVVAVGGGVVGDLAGFAASTFMRGIPWVCVPTTLLSMVDASLGGKTGFDLAEGKNLIGSFHAPRLVLADPDLLSSLPPVEMRAGLAEMLKHGVVADPELFGLCGRGYDWVVGHLAELLPRAIAVKVKIVEADPYERGERASLNLGHTIGHAVELVSRFSIRHGEAVAIGMVAEAKLAERLGMARDGLAQEIATVLSALGLPTNIPEELPRSELIQAMRADKKKAGGVVRFALPVEIGQVRINVELKDLELAFPEG